MRARARTGRGPRSPQLRVAHRTTAPMAYKIPRTQPRQETQAWAIEPAPVLARALGDYNMQHTASDSTIHSVCCTIPDLTIRVLYKKPRSHAFSRQA
eukprot:2555327-Prymnesium_polylepis.2